MFQQPFSSRLLAALLLTGSLLTNITAIAAEDGPQTLRLHWEPGTVYTQETTTETTMVLTSLGFPQDQKMKVKQTTTLAVTATPAQSHEVRVTFTALVGELNHEGHAYPFDSKDLSKAHPLIRQTLGESVGKSFILAYDKEDKFIEARDTAPMADTSTGQASLESLAQAGEVAQLYRRSIEMGLPKTTVRPGDQWTSKEMVVFPKAGTMNVELRAKFDSILDYDGRPHAKISFEGEMKRPEEPESNDTPAISSRRVTIGEGSKTFGQILFDLDRKTASFSTFRADISLEIEGKKVPVRQQVSTKLVSMEKKS